MKVNIIMTRKLKGFVIIADIVIDYIKENIKEFGEKGENRMKIIDLLNKIAKRRRST